MKRDLRLLVVVQSAGLNPLELSAVVIASDGEGFNVELKHLDITGIQPEGRIEYFIP